MQEKKDGEYASGHDSAPPGECIGHRAFGFPKGASEDPELDVRHRRSRRSLAAL